MKNEFKSEHERIAELEEQVLELMKKLSSPNDDETISEEPIQELGEEEIVETLALLEDPRSLLKGSANLSIEAVEMISSGEVDDLLNAAFVIQEARFKLQEATFSILQQTFKDSVEDSVFNEITSTLASIYFPQPIFYGLGIPRGKIRIMGKLIADVLGIPTELFEEYFEKELKQLYKALWRAESKNKWDKASKILNRILKKITGKRFRNWIIKKVGKKEAAKILGKFIAGKIPFVLPVLIVGSIIVRLGEILDP